ncbi:putative porin [Peristeroidobacter soli]|jgi:hypothetical protein|uniref:putative porin n=1 Tax=Peristeroidobacter soli TaxID=2497877 RepID=UPI0013004524|nr:putative porin [Peristeroidobacter soli]
MGNQNPVANQKLAHACALILLGAAASHQVHAQTQTPSEQVQAAESTAAASAAQTSSVTIALIQELVREGVITLERAQQLLDAAEREASLARQRQTPPPSNQVRVPYVPESVKNEMREELRKEITTQAKNERWGTPDALPEWLDRISWSGDFRLRYHGDFFDSGNFPFVPDVQAINNAGGVTTADGFPFVNATEDRNRVRYRARMELTAKVTDGVKVGIGLASGQDNGPISTNKTFGDYFTKDAGWIDLAYIEAQPFKQLTLIGGRMANPFFSTDLVWDTDLRMEGVAAQFRQPFGPATVFLNGGAFPLRELDVESDSWLYAGQLGSKLTFGNLEFTLAGAYYDFDNVQSKLNPPDGSRLNDFTRPPILGPGNSVFNMRTDGLTTLAGLASKFELMNITADVAYRFGDGKAVRFTGDYVRNRALDTAEIDRLRGEPGVPAGDTGWQARIQVGDVRIADRHDWSFAATYRKLETDAVLAAFTDSDFGVYGGTDLKGYAVEASYGLTRNTWLTLEWDSADSIDRPPFSTDVVLLDVNARF